MLNKQIYDNPRILVFASDPHRRQLAIEAVQSIGGSAVFSDGEETVAAAGCAAILVEGGCDHDVVLHAGLARPAAIRAADEVPAIVCCSFSQIDAIEAELFQTKATLLVDPGQAERVGALALAVHTRDFSVASGVREIDPVRLRRLADEVGRIARALAGLSSEATERSTEYARDVETSLNDDKRGFAVEPADLASAALPPAEAVRKLIRMRRLRDNFFEGELFADPAWDIMLDLLAAEIEGEQVAVSSLCIAAAVPATTALRWIRAMTEQGLLERHADPEDGRRFHIRLSTSTQSRLARYFATVERAEGVAI